MIYIFLSAIIVLLLIVLWLSFKSQSNSKEDDFLLLKNAMINLNQAIKDSERNLKDEFVVNRKENAENAKNLREEIGRELNSFTKIFSEQLFTFQNTIEKNNKENRGEQKDSLIDFSNKQRANFSELQQNLSTQSDMTFTRLEAMRITVEDKITQLREGNEKKLDEMRKTVDEKLNETLEKRLGESFKQVSERLEKVHEGLGQMQTLASNVGDLKKVMTNVKSRGVLGEYQLQNLLEDLLTNEQYEKNVKTKIGSGAVVEFAIRMPSGNNFEKTLWLPIDSKFPKEDYELLVEAYENSDGEKIEIYRRAFVKGIRRNAQDIREKYIDPPNTTEYGIMFLPYESLYGEVLRTPGLFEQLQRDYKITITGPTTLSALLNSLQMGFRTLAIEKRSSEVWDLLSAVKTEFGKFGDMIAKTKKKLEEASNELGNSERRTNAIRRKLQNVQELPQERASLILNKDKDENLSDEDFQRV
ncbi:DNA recombination protein RmuC [Arachidicoccus sp.]|uniref:DNA recombination protein RmuC n=1 Tax=Arachidicoccus sp. TaxID=1872624 RepID=UPI003D1941AD